MKFKKDDNYFVSDNLKIAFLNIPKNGSTSIRNSLGLTKRVKFNVVKDSFKFTVIRNPIDRFASGMYEVSLLRDDGDYEFTKSLAWYKYFKNEEYSNAVICLLSTLKVHGFYDEHLFPQNTHLSNRSVIIKDLDFIINFDDMKSDFKKMTSKLGIRSNLLHHRKSDKKIVSTIRSVLILDDVFKEFEDLYYNDFQLYKQIKNDRIS